MQFFTNFDCFPRKGTLFLLFFFWFIRFQKSKKSVPLRGKCTFFTNFDCFPRKGTLFLLFFWNLSDRKQKSKKSVPLRGKCTFFTNFDCFPRKGTLFLLFFSDKSDFKRVKKVYPYEENALFLLILTVFLVRVHFFYSFFLIYQISKE